MAPWTANNYLSNLKWKIESVFGLYGNGILDGLFPSVHLATILISLPIDGGPEAIVNRQIRTSFEITVLALNL